MVSEVLQQNLSGNCKKKRGRQADIGSGQAALAALLSSRP